MRGVGVARELQDHSPLGRTGKVLLAVWEKYGCLTPRDASSNLLFPNDEKARIMEIVIAVQGE